MADKVKTKDLGSLTTTPAAGAAVSTEFMYKYDKQVTIGGTFVATVKLEGSNDNVTWVQDGADIAVGSRYVRGGAIDGMLGVLGGDLFRRRGVRFVHLQISSEVVVLELLT